MRSSHTSELLPEAPIATRSPRRTGWRARVCQLRDANAVEIVHHVLFDADHVIAIASAP
ncbi:MAG TPA: hypothetical protein VIP77_06070 [Jiangellaceae bacterium]